MEKAYQTTRKVDLKTGAMISGGHANFTSSVKRESRGNKSAAQTPLSASDTARCLFEICNQDERGISCGTGYGQLLAVARQSEATEII